MDAENEQQKNLQELLEYREFQEKRERAKRGVLVMDFGQGPEDTSESQYIRPQEAE